MAVVPRSLFRRALHKQTALKPVSFGLIAILCLSGIFGGHTYAQEDASVDASVRYLADLQLHTEEEMLSLLQRAQLLLVDGTLQPGQEPAVTFVLHGPEVRLLTTDHYLAHRQVADLAASLSALGVVEINACLTWMGKNDLTEPMLLPFVKTVPFGPSEARRLREQEELVAF